MRDEAELRTAANDIEAKLDELRAMVAPAAFARVEEILERVVQLYGCGLGRVLDHARAHGAGAELADRVAADDLLASLLLLHGLHPHDVEQRVRAAVARATDTLGADAGPIDVIAVRDGVVQLHAGALGGGAMSARLAEAAIRRAIEDAAPEVTRIEIAGLPPAPPQPHAAGLVQIRLSREATR